MNTPRLPLDAVVASGVLVTVFATVTLLAHRFGPANWRTALGAGGVAVGGTFLLGAGVLLLLYRVRRRVTIEMNATELILSEAALFRPARETWPGVRIVGPVLSVRPGGRRADLSLQLTDGPPAVLIVNGPTRDVRFVHDTLAIALSRRPPQPVVSVGTAG